MLAVKPLGPTAAFSASQIPSEREDAQYDLRGARSYPTLEDEGDWPTWGRIYRGASGGLVGLGPGKQLQRSLSIEDSTITITIRYRGVIGHTAWRWD